jgi:hypothetical protein
MSSIVIAGDTSGSVTLQAPAVSGSTILTLPATSGTVQTSGAGYTTNGVAFASSTSVLATGSALSFDGTNLGIGTASPANPLQIVSNTVSQLNVAASSGNTNAQINLEPTGTGIALIGPANNVAFAFRTNATERARIDASGNLGLGVTPSAWNTAGGAALQVKNASLISYASVDLELAYNSFYDGTSYKYISNGFATRYDQYAGVHSWYRAASGTAGNTISFTQSMTLDASGRLLVGKTTDSFGIAGTTLYSSGEVNFVRSAATVLYVNRLTDDGNLIELAQDNTTEGSISVSGTTVSYNGGHLSRWAQTTTAKDESLVKGTVLSNLDEMNVYTKDGQPVANEQLNKVKVSDTEGDANVAGVFVNWSHDEDHNVDEINMAMTGDMIIRIAQGTTVVRGDLLMSAGDGTAKPQGDDIVRSKTVAKVTSNHITCTYADGSYCVPCVLMAC